MQLSKIMTKKVELLDSEATVREAAQLMRKKGIGAIPVFKDDRLIGMITDRDIVVKALANDLDITMTKVSQIMHSPIAYAFDDMEIDEAALIMEKQKIRRLPVLNRKKRLVGFVSLGDIAVKGDDEELSGEVLEAVCEAASH